MPNSASCYLLITIHQNSQKIKKVEEMYLSNRQASDMTPG